MRAIKSVLVVAGGFKRADASLSEQAARQQPRQSHPEVLPSSLSSLESWPDVCCPEVVLQSLALKSHPKVFA